MKDYKGYEVKEGMFLLENNEDHAYVFQVREGKAALFARWGLGVLEQYNTEMASKSLEKAKQSYQDLTEPGISFIINYYETHFKRMDTMKIEDLEIAHEINQPIFKRFVEEDLEFIPFSSDEEDADNGFIPEAEFPDGSIMRGTYDSYHGNPIL